MRIPCPYCGDRDAREFVYRGDAAPRRPDGDDGMFAYVYLRDNLAGPMREHWYHAQGCRTWITVARDTRTHAIAGASLTQPPPLFPEDVGGRCAGSPSVDAAANERDRDRSRPAGGAHR